MQHVQCNLSKEIGRLHDCASSSGRRSRKELARAPVSDGVPIASVETVVLMKLLAGRTQDLADIEAIVASRADRERLRSVLAEAAPDHVVVLERLYDNVDRAR